MIARASDDVNGQPLVCYKINIEQCINMHYVIDPKWMLLSLGDEKGITESILLISVPVLIIMIVVHASLPGLLVY